MITNYAFLVTTAFVSFVGDAPLASVAQKVSEIIVEDPKVEEKLYHQDFLKAVPPAQLRDLAKRLYQAHGKVVGVTELSADSMVDGRFLFALSDGSVMEVSLNLDDVVSRRITGLRFHGARPGLKSWEDLRTAFEKLPGGAGFRVLQITPDAPIEHDPSDSAMSGSVIAEFNPDKSLAVGSAFKLYILAELVERGEPWDKVVSLNKDWYSVPSGVMHTWPANAPVTLHTLALQMISISDNTATDHLLMYLGRDAVWERMRLTNAEPEKSRPFLRTIEMFKLKDDETMRKRYIAADLGERNRILDTELPAIPRDQVRGALWPTAIDTVEWFASPADLCRLMTYFHRKADPQVQQILAVNPGVRLPKSRFPYVGYKGGSEPGVLNVTWLLQTSNGRAYAATATWNDPAKSLDDDHFIGLMTSALHLLAREEK